MRHNCNESSRGLGVEGKWGCHGRASRAPALGSTPESPSRQRVRGSRRAPARPWAPKNAKCCVSGTGAGQGACQNSVIDRRRSPRAERNELVQSERGAGLLGGPSSSPVLPGPLVRKPWLGSRFVAPGVSAPRFAERCSRVGFGQGRLYHFKEFCKSTPSEKNFSVLNLAQFNPFS